MSREGLVAAWCAVLTSLIAGCATADRDKGPGDHETFATSAEASGLPLLAVSMFPAANRIMPGFEIVPSSGSWREGDRVLLGIRSERGREAVTRYLLVEISAPIRLPRSGEFTLTNTRGGKTVRYVCRSDQIATNLTVFDERGTVISRGDGSLPVYMTTIGLGTHAEWVCERGGKRLGDTEAFPKEATAGFFSLTSFAGQGSHNAQLSSLVEMAVDRPSLLDLVLDQGLNIGAKDPPTTLGRIHLSEDTTAEAYVFPVELSLGSRVMFRAKMIVTPSCPPLGLTAGLLGFEAQHPSDPTRRVSCRVLAARRGGGREYDPGVFRMEELPGSP